MIINDSHWSIPETDFPLEFKISDGKFPLLRLPMLYRGNENPYFPNVGGYARARVAGHIRLDSAGYVHKYRMRRRGTVTLYSGFFSSMGLSKSLDYLPSTMIGRNKSYRMYGNPDIFCLGVVDVNKLPKLTFDSKPSYYGLRAQVVIKPEDVTILISKENLRKTLLTREKYTATVRSEILYEIQRLNHTLKYKTEDVSNEYLSQFIQVPEYFRTNSMIEAMRVEQEIKSDVFSNLQSVLL